MDWLSVKSTTISKVRYNKDTNTLDIEFPGGRIHRFLEVPPEVFEELMSAESHGQFFHDQIMGKYRCLRIS